MYKKCNEIGHKKNAVCSECGIRSNLVYCLDCDVLFCDGRGHLTSHLRDNPTHTKLYSFKLRRQIKCCKATCEKMNIYELMTCAECIDRCFDRHYSMVTATWSNQGLKYLPNTICCEEHLQWHTVNCLNSNPGHFIEQNKLDSDAYNGHLSEYFF